MPLFVQLEDHGEPLWHAVESFETVEGAGGSSLDFKRSYTCGCGLVKVASASRLLESANPPWTNRHVAKGCFKTAVQKQTAVDERTAKLLAEAPTTHEGNSLTRLSASMPTGKDR